MKEHACASRRGFTLLELVVGLVLLSFLAAVVIPRAVHMGAGTVAEAERLRANLRFAQSCALANNTADWSVLVQEDTYQLLRNGEPSPLPFPGESGALRVLATGVRITSGSGLLELDRLGAPAESREIEISDGHRTERVVMFGLTGLVP